MRLSRWACTLEWHTDGNVVFRVGLLKEHTCLQKTAWSNVNAKALSLLGSGVVGDRIAAIGHRVHWPPTMLPNGIGANHGARERGQARGTLTHTGVREFAGFVRAYRPGGVDPHPVMDQPRVEQAPRCGWFCYFTSVCEATPGGALRIDQRWLR